ncbi:MAG: FTR1 family iron permease [Deltaproteobacteria bacterium]|nr:FTR1 family iron permease [Deltaproteobacteria bacterium]
MLPSFIITFREVLEAALVVGIILSYLVRVKQTKYNTIVYAGIFSGIVASIIGAVLFTTLAGGFTGRAEEIFEGITMLVGAALLTTMILWMMKQKHIARELENRVATELTEAHKFGLFSLVFVAILREGIETVIFLRAATLVSTGNTMLGALAGVLAAILLGYAIFLGSMRINLKRFFNITSILLILFAAGLVAHGVHELQEAKVIPTVIEHIWNVNPPANLDGSYPILHEKGHVGSILKSLFGYNGNPSLIEVLSYLLYITLVVGLWRNIEKNKKAEQVLMKGNMGFMTQQSIT